MRPLPLIVSASLLATLHLAAAEPAAEVLAPDDEAPAPAKVADKPKAQPHDDKTPPAPKAEDDPILHPTAPTPPTPTTVASNDKKNPNEGPSSVPLVIDEPGFSAKLTFPEAPARKTEKKIAGASRNWGVAEEDGVDGVLPEEDTTSAIEEPDEISPLLAKAMARDNKNKKPKEVALMYQEVVTSEPSNPEAHYQLGVALVKAGEAPKGVEEIQAAIVLKPRNAKYLCAFGQAALQMGWIEKALAACQAAALAAPKEARYQSAWGDCFLAAGDLQQAAAAYGRAVSIDKGKNADYIFNLGLVHLHSRNFKQAIQIFDEAITLRKDYAPYYSSRGLAHENMKNIKQAINDYAQALKIDKNDAYAHFLLAGIYSDPDDPTYTNKFEAVTHAEKANKLTEYKNARYLMGLARALRVAFNYDQAVFFARKAIAIDPREDYRQELAKYEAQLKQEGAYLDEGKKK